MQLCVRADEPCASKFISPLFMENQSLNKPVGGLWTASWLGPRLGSNWVQWCLENNFAYGLENSFPCWLLIPDRHARIFTIDSYVDLEVLDHLYGVPLFEGSSMRSFDFGRMSLDYDAVHLTMRGQLQTRLSHPLSLYGWDCECTLWLSFKFDSIENLGRQKFMNGCV